MDANRELLNKIGVLLEQGQVEQAVAMTQNSLASSPAAGMRVLLNNLLMQGAVALEKFEMAESAMRESVFLLKKLFSPDHPHVASALHNLSMLLGQANRHEEAIPVSDEEVAILEKLLPEGKSTYAGAIVTLAQHYYELSRFEHAETLLGKALSLYREADGERSFGVSTCLNNLGRLHENVNRNELGVKELGEAASIRIELLGVHPDTAFTMLNYGTGLAGIGAFAEAKSVLAQTVNIYDTMGMGDCGYAAAAKENIALCERELQKA